MNEKKKKKIEQILKIFKDDITNDILGISFLGDNSINLRFTGTIYRSNIRQMSKLGANILFICDNEIVFQLVDKD